MQAIDVRNMDNRWDPITSIIKKFGDIDYMVSTDGKLENPYANLLKQILYAERYEKCYDVLTTLVVSLI